MVLEGTATTNTKNDTAYYNPKELYSIYLIPMLEHLWFERYKKSMTDRLYVGWGVQWQKGFSDKSIWHIRYEQDYELSDVLSFLVGFSYSQENYDGAYLNVNTLDFALSYMF